LLLNLRSSHANLWQRWIDGTPNFRRVLIG
jgi:hypothetical protein